MKGFRTYELAVSFYRGCQRVEIKDRVIKDQFKRASLSIVLNLSEGYGRITEKDRRKFYSIAYGSLRETQCLLMLMGQDELLGVSDSVAACLFQLLRKPGCLKV